MKLHYFLLTLAFVASSINADPPGAALPPLPKLRRQLKTLPQPQPEAPTPLPVPVVPPVPPIPNMESPAFLLDTRDAPGPPVVWVAEPESALKVSTAFAETAKVYGVGRPDGAKLNAYTNGVRLAIAWASSPGSNVSIMMKSDPHSMVGQWIVFTGKDVGAATVALDRLGWAIPGPIYLEVTCQGPGAPATVWRSEPFLLIKGEDTDEVIAKAVDSLRSGHPASAKKG